MAEGAGKSRCSVASLEVGGGNAVSLATVKSLEGGILVTYVGLKDCWVKIVKPQPRQTFYNHVQNCLEEGKYGVKQRTANGDELNHLVETGAIKSRAPTTVLINTQLLASALHKMPGKSHLVPAVLELCNARTPAMSPPTTILPAVSAAPQQAQEAEHPVQLPACPVDLNTFPKHYSLPQQLRKQPGIQRDVEDLESYLRAPVDTTREGGCSAARTVDNLMRNVWLYLGFCYFHFGVTVFHLALFMDLRMYAAYIAFQLAKGNGAACLSQQLSNARKVCSFLKRIASPERVAAVDRVVVWLARVSKQLGKVMPQARQDIGELEEAGGWMPAQDVVVLMERVRVQALAALPADKQAPLDWGTARLLHDAALGNTMFGHIPPLRLACLRTMQVPWLKGCVHPDCIGSIGNQKCKGNTLEKRGEEMWMILSHHKNKTKWLGRSIQFKVPQLLMEILTTYIHRGYFVISPGSDFIFSDSKGRPMEQPSQLTFWWEQLMRRCDAPAMFPPGRLRKIFVDERRGPKAAKGPTNAQAAQLMGNSEEAWNRHYDLNLSLRESQAGAEASAGWREQMLQMGAGEEDSVIDLSSDSEDDIEIEL